MEKFIVFLSIFLTISIHASTRTQVIMGTFITITVDEKETSALQNGFEIFKDVDASLSTFNHDAVIYKLNRDKKVLLNQYAYEALVLSSNYYKATDGYFDITIGSLTKDAYKFGDKPEIPSAQLVNDSEVDFTKLYFDKHEARIADGIKLDFGGMGKGFAVDKVGSYFLSQGIDSAVIAASGDIRCLNFCSIEINNPFHEKNLASFRTSQKNLGISTSGNYNRYAKEIKNNHLINPKTKKPQLKFVSITLIGTMLSSDLDAYATAVSVMPIKKAYDFLKSLPLAYLIMQSDGVLKVSDNINNYTKNLHVNDTGEEDPDAIDNKKFKRQE